VSVGVSGTVAWLKTSRKSL